MSFNFSYYNQIRNKICILYVGYNQDYIVLLHLLKSQICKTFPIDVTLCYRDEYGYWFNDFLPFSKFDRMKFVYVKEVVMDASDLVHPVHKLLIESDIPIPALPTNRPQTQIGLICPQGMWPTQSLNQTQIDKLKDWLRAKRLKPYVIGQQGIESDLKVDVMINDKDKLGIVDMTGFAVGVESDVLFYAGGKGIPTALVPTGYGTELYRNMFQNSTILKV